MKINPTRKTPASLIFISFLALIFTGAHEGYGQMSLASVSKSNMGNRFGVEESVWKKYNFPLTEGATAKKDTAADTLTFNQKMEKLFRVIPVPLFSYSSDAGNIFGLAKFNLFQLSKKDTISKPSKVSGVFTMSTKGRVNFSLSTELVFKANKYILISFINYKKTPEFIFGIGNDVSRDDMEEVTTDRFKWVATGLMRVGSSESFYAGLGIDINDYFKVVTEDSSFLRSENITGVEGGTGVGVGIAGAFDTRDNRYNASKGSYVISTWTFYPEFLGSSYQYTKFTIDARKFFNPWWKHVIAFQATTAFANHDVPFYELSMMGGDSQMRGYYLGALRDHVLVDGQMEYRMPVWGIFGATTWIATGRVAEKYNDLQFQDWWLSYGVGFRVRVDTKSNVNMRVDFGFGPGGITGTYINFAEAF